MFSFWRFQKYLSARLMKRGGPISGIPILSRINPVPHIETNFFKIHSDIVLPSTQVLPRGLFLVILTNSMTYGTRRFNATSKYFHIISILRQILSYNLYPETN